MPKKASAANKALLPWHKISAFASAKMCGLRESQMGEKHRPLRKMLFWHQGHTFVNYFHSSSGVMMTTDDEKVSNWSPLECLSRLILLQIDVLNIF